MNRKKVLHKFVILYASMVLLFIFAQVEAQVGFKAELDYPPSFVSPYYSVLGQYVSSIAPDSYPLLTYRMELRPNAAASNYAENSIRFQTMYYRYRAIKKYLVPVSVDAQRYMVFNLENTYERDLLETSRESIQKDKSKRRRGLGINVALPARLNKIFGEGGAGLKVSGYRRITFAGRSQWTDAASTPTYQQSKFPSLRMEPVSRFEKTVPIGTKRTVRVSL